MEGREREGPQVTVEPGSLSVLQRHCLLQRHVLQLLTHSTHLSQHLCTYTHIVCFVCCFYLLFQLHIVCYPAIGPQGCY